MCDTLYMQPCTHRIDARPMKTVIALLLSCSESAKVMHHTTAMITVAKPDSIDLCSATYNSEHSSQHSSFGS